MDKIARFREFIAKNERESTQMAREILEDFFSEELKTIDAIEDIVKDYADDGLGCIFRVIINNPNEGNRFMHPFCQLIDEYGKKDNIELIDLILSKFKSSLIPDNVEYWKEHGHKLVVFIRGLKVHGVELHGWSSLKPGDEKWVKSKLKEMVERLQSAIPQVTVKLDDDWEIKISF